jgi:hypothetical protein
MRLRSQRSAPVTAAPDRHRHHSDYLKPARRERRRSTAASRGARPPTCPIAPSSYSMGDAQSACECSAATARPSSAPATAHSANCFRQTTVSVSAGLQGSLGGRQDGQWLRVAGLSDHPTRSRPEARSLSALQGNLEVRPPCDQGEGGTPSTARHASVRARLRIDRALCLTRSGTTFAYTRATIMLLPTP